MQMYSQLQPAQCHLLYNVDDNTLNGASQKSFRDSRILRHHSDYTLRYESYAIYKACYLRRTSVQYLILSLIHI